MRTISTSPPSSNNERPTAELIGGARALMSTRADGDLRPPEGDSPAADAARRQILDRSWTLVRQVHGNRVEVIEQPAGVLEVEADAIVTSSPEVAIAVLGADCPLVALSSDEGVIGAVHAGWRGLVAGVLPAATAAMRRLGATQIRGVASPFIRQEDYGFSEPELALVANELGEAVRGRDRAGKPALDLEVTLGRALVRAGATLQGLLGPSTADERFFSERVRADHGRHALVIWREKT